MRPWCVNGVVAKDVHAVAEALIRAARGEGRLRIHSSHGVINVHKGATTEEVIKHAKECKLMFCRNDEEPQKPVDASHRARRAPFTKQGDLFG